MTEQRISERKRCFYAAHVVFDEGLDVFPCIVNDISMRGANISIDASLILPDVFDLSIPLRDETHKVKKRWRDRDTVGVEFIPASTADVSEVQKLIERNDKLEKIVAHLTERLACLGHVVDTKFEAL